MLVHRPEYNTSAIVWILLQTSIGYFLGKLYQDLSECCYTMDDTEGRHALVLSAGTITIFTILIGVRKWRPATAANAEPRERTIALYHIILISQISAGLQLVGQAFVKKYWVTVTDERHWATVEGAV